MSRITLPPKNAVSVERAPYRDGEENIEGEQDSGNVGTMESQQFSRSPLAIIVLLFTIIFILSFGGHLMGVPALRIYEDIVCRHYYAGLDGEGHVGLGDDIDESMCKGVEVQSQLNILLAGLYFLGVLPGLFMTVPYGLLADKIGRRPVFLLSITGMVLGCIYNFTIMYFWKTFPIRLIWLSPLSTLIGGGMGVTSMMFFAIGSDITNDSNRANMFMLGQCASLVAEIVSPSVAAFLMKRSPWIPLLTGLGLLIVGMLPAFWIPETIHRKIDATLDSASDQSWSSKWNTGFLAALKAHTADGLTQISESLKVINSVPILLLLIPFATGPFGYQCVELSLRYISRRFSWQLSNTAFLLSLRSFVSLVLLAAILPAISNFLVERLQFTARAKDLLIARVSVILLFAGALMMAASPTISLTIIGLAVLTLGSGLTFIVRALITTLVDREHVARLYSAIAIVELSSALVASPTLAALYSVGLNWNGPWIGLPFYGLAVICFFGGLGLWFFGWISPTQHEMPCDSEERDELLANTRVRSPETDE